MRLRTAYRKLLFRWLAEIMFENAHASGPSMKKERSQPRAEIHMDLHLEDGGVLKSTDLGRQKLVCVRSDEGDGKTVDVSFLKAATLRETIWIVREGVLLRVPNVEAFFLQWYTLLIELQLRHSKRKLEKARSRIWARADRMAVLKIVLAAHQARLKNGLNPFFDATNYHLLNTLAEGDALQLHAALQDRHRLELILDSLVFTGDLTKFKGHYRASDKAIVTLATYQSEERRHNDHLNAQRVLQALTSVLAIAAIVGAGLTACELSNPPPILDADAIAAIRAAEPS